VLQDAEGTERTEFTQRNRGTEVERSGECGRARNAGPLTKEAAQTQTGGWILGLRLRRFFRQRDGWLRQPPAARSLALFVSVAPFLYVSSVASVFSVVYGITLATAASR